ncbi:hypothetical protein E2C01_027695 [Portunus trituberculatus]|uniref:Uncharacterized protein n=1 Tax=Portunus trituberculatus TaxID=210409 RepID=A0A5B7EII8_PORTR|nr:hypothetical protein [Portunus trituberculatus]
MINHAAVKAGNALPRTAVESVQSPTNAESARQRRSTDSEGSRGTCARVSSRIDIGEETWVACVRDPSVSTLFPVTTRQNQETFNRISL